jgi:L-lactate dehydrogenase complex protein LldG
MNREETVVLFLEKAALAAAGARRVANAAEMAGAISELVAADKAVYCPALSGLERAAAAVLVRQVAGYREAEVTVEEVLAGIAETGSIVCASVEGRAVQASLLPSHHLALLPAEKIYPTLDDFFQSLSKAPPTNLAVITGPSRTADIELTLAIGVHGPERLDVIVIAG